MTEATFSETQAYYVRRHLVFAWAALLLFLSLGAVLEALHGLKLGFYLDLSNATRRHLWTLAHAHGTLLALVHAVFALTVRGLPDLAAGALAIASPCLMAASVLMPAGFFLGGVVFYGGDPGFGILLVPIGAVLLFVSALLVLRTALAAR